MKRNRQGFKYPHARGVSLIELMIAMLLGLLVVGAAIGIFLTNRQTYAATEGLGRVQENVRTAFELMARDVREAGGNPCDSSLPTVNVTAADPTTDWRTDWVRPVIGFENGSLPASVAGTDAIQLLSGGAGVSTVTSHNAATMLFTLNAAHGFSTGDVLLVCDPQQLSIFRVSSNTGNTVGHAATGGNCSDSLGSLPSVCSGTAFTHLPNSVMTQLNATRWYVAANGRNGNSLYQNVGGTVGEVAEGVQDMQITYLLTGATGYVNGSAVTDWAQVRAVRFDLTLASQDRVGSDGNPITRQLIHVVTIRSRNV